MGVDPCSEEVRRLLRPTLPDGACASLFVAPVERPRPASRGIADGQEAPPAYEYCRTQPRLVFSSPLVENVSPSQPPLSLFWNAAMLAPHTSDVNEHTYGLGEDPLQRQLDFYSLPSRRVIRLHCHEASWREF